jgi:hAT family C-terminal dimerisation region
MINARGAVKDAVWIAQQCKDVIHDLHHVSESTRVCGFIMDSASANRKAYEELLEATKDMTVCDEDHEGGLGPLVLLQCASHTLSLLIRDITQHFGWVHDVYTNAVMLSKALNNNERIHDCYRRACIAQNVTPVSIDKHCETRFGSYHFVLRSVVKVISPLKHMCASDEFEELAKVVDAAKSVMNTVTPSGDTSFRHYAPIVEELMCPIMEEMHRVEADVPMLSSMLPLVQGLIDHANTFSTKHAVLIDAHKVQEFAELLAGYDSDSDLDDFDDLASLFKRRLIDFYMKDSMLAAYMLDPMNFVTSNRGASYNLPWNGLSDEEEDKFCDEVERLGGEKAVEDLRRVKREGIVFKRKLDIQDAKKCIAVMCAGANEVASVSPIKDRRYLWSSALAKVFPTLAVVAAMLLSMHVTSCASERNLSKFGRLYDKMRARLLIERGEKMVFVSQNRNKRAVVQVDEDVIVADLEEFVSEELNAAEARVAEGSINITV